MKQLHDGKAIEEIDIKLQLKALKPLHADWLVGLYNEMKEFEGEQVIMSGWKTAGIIEAIEKGSAQLESIDIFSDLDPLLTQTKNDEMLPTNLVEGERELSTNQYTEDVKERDDGSI